MAEVTLTLENFWALRERLPLVDARSEGEFAQSHIPGAINIPILNNTERIQVGTLYKQAGPEKATLKGFELVGPDFTSFNGKHSVILKKKKYCSIAGAVGCGVRFFPGY